MHTVTWPDNTIRDIFEIGDGFNHQYVDKVTPKDVFTPTDAKGLEIAQKLAMVPDKWGKTVASSSNTSTAKHEDLAKYAQAWVNDVVDKMKRAGYEFAGFANAVLPSHVWLAGGANAATPGQLFNALDFGTFKLSDGVGCFVDMCSACAGGNPDPFLIGTKHIVIRANAGARLGYDKEELPYYMCQISDMFFARKQDMSKETQEFAKNRMLNGLEFAMVGSRGSNAGERLTEKESIYLSNNPMGFLPFSNMNFASQNLGRPSVIQSNYTRNGIEIYTHFGLLSDLRSIMVDASRTSYVKFFNSAFTARVPRSDGTLGDGCLYMEPRHNGDSNPFLRKPGLRNLILQSGPEGTTSLNLFRQIIDQCRHYVPATGCLALPNLEYRSIRDIQAWFDERCLTSISKTTALSSVNQSWYRRRLQVPYILNSPEQECYLDSIMPDDGRTTPYTNRSLFTAPDGYKQIIYRGDAGYFGQALKLAELNAIVGFFL